MKNYIVQGTLDPAKMIKHVVGGGLSNTNGMPLILFMDDNTVLKFTYHFKTDYDLCLERNEKMPSQWQGINGILIHDAIQEKVPGENGTGIVYNSCVLIDQTKEMTETLQALEDCPAYLVNYFVFCLRELEEDNAYDEMTVIQMEEYHGFLSNIFKTPQMIGLYDAIVKSTLFEVVFYYFKIKHYLKTFKHNDLHMENIMLHPIEIVSDIRYTKFIKGTDEEYYVPYFGFESKIIDFGLSEIAELGIRSVLDNTTAMSSALDSGNETKLLLKFMSTEESQALLGSDPDDYMNNGIECSSDIFESFRAKKNDPREQFVRKIVTWN